MGIVYMAHDTLLDRLVAVKFIAPIDPHSPVRKRFLVEARAAARLQHPNVVSIHGVGELEGRPYIISEFIRGTSLHKVERPMPWRQVLDIGIGLARGLAAAHRQGILHRDIKPANAILSDDGGVKLLDFGLAKFLEANTTLAEGAVTAAASGQFHQLALAALGQPHSVQVLGNADQPIAEGTPNRFASQDGTAGDALVELPQAQMSNNSLGLTRVAHNPGTAVWGTPKYMPPEIWLGKSATRRSDVYSLGVVLFELCAGQDPYAKYPANELPYIVTEEDASSLAETVPGIDADFAAVIDRSLRRNPDERFASADDLREALEGLVSTTRFAQVPEGNPYRGLLPFEAEHRALFFGRSPEIRTLCERLRAHSFVLVAGDSGVGKSSLCRAGVIPHLLDGAMGDDRRWSSVGLMPGVHPCHELVTALESVFDASADELGDELYRNPHTFVRGLQSRLGTDRGLLIFVDQLEELITVSDRDEEEAFCEVLSYIAEQFGNLRLLATVRSDFLARVAATPILGDEISQALYILRPMSPDKIREAITGPVRAKGVAFESDSMIEMLVESTTRAQGGLPLLQFALAELWDAHPTTATTISACGLEAIGGVEGALARHADSVLLGLPHRQRRTARRMLTALVTAEGTRKRRNEEELIADDASALTALDALVQGRLLVARENDGGSVYELAHEALISGWKTLRGWLDEDVESRVVKQRLEASANEWERLGHSREVLWSTRQVTEARVLERRELGSRERAFLVASERALKRRRYLRNAVLVGAPLLLVALYGFVQIKAARDLDQRVAEHVASGKKVHSIATQKKHDLDALRTLAFAAFDDRQREKGETLWEQARDLSASTDNLFRSAGQAFEAALTVRGSRSDVRELLGDILFERALLAEQSRNVFLRDELIERLSVYDDTGERMQQWSAPARLTIESEPSGATVTIARYAPDKSGRLSLSEPRQLGTTPIATAAVPPGSYMLTLTSKKRPVVRYPILLGRDEKLRVDIPLPLAADIPKGFVYIPPGRFLFGSSDQEMVRRQFLTAVPLHQVTTDGYLIAKHETTYAEWIKYLRSMSPETRLAQLGTTGKKGAMGGATSLQVLPDGSWRFSMTPASKTYEAKSGQRIIYRSRKMRIRQNWLRFPASGMTFAEATAYADWLDKTGRVPGARLCTDHEWERAARGADDRMFPHGSQLRPEDANYDETYGKVLDSMGPDEVGSYAASRTPFGIYDMVGNVFEWTISSVKPNQVVARGGAYFYDQTTSRISNRFILETTFQDPSLGIRICAPLVKSRKTR